MATMKLRDIKRPTELPGQVNEIFGSYGSAEMANGQQIFGCEAGMNCSFVTLQRGSTMQSCIGDVSFQ
jgi:hypothetical protein